MTTAATSAPSYTRAQVAKAWADALALWDVTTNLSPPEPWTGGGGGHLGGEEPLAYTDMERRQVVVNFPMLRQLEAASSLTAVLAHEIGHHVRYPHTLGLAAALELLEHRLIPGLKQSLLNLFFDLLVNELVGRTHADELSAVYRGFVKQSKTVSPLFFFYLAIYEELWGKDPGHLVPAAQIEEMEKTHPGCRAEARLFAQTFYALPDIYLQFVYFCSRFLFYIPEPTGLSYENPFAGDLAKPDLDDYDAAAQGSQQAEDALEEAEARGWIKGVARAKDARDPLNNLNSLMSRMQGRGVAAFKRALVSRHYKRLVDQHILRLPGETPPPDPYLPTVLEDWEWGDNPRTIDWTATILATGPLAAAKPLRRDLDADLPKPQERDLPSVEIYLDTSGSMPSPDSALNAMTLAAQILSASAIRKNGKVKAVVYSDGKPKVSDWMYDEEKAREFLLQFAAGGTDFPFPVLHDLAEERSDVLRVIVSDDGFLWNLKGTKGAQNTLAHAVSRSTLLVAFLLLWSGAKRPEELKEVQGDPRFRLVVVKNAGKLAEAAADLARALLGI